MLMIVPSALVFSVLRRVASSFGEFAPGPEAAIKDLELAVFTKLVAGAQDFVGEEFELVIGPFRYPKWRYRWGGYVGVRIYTISTVVVERTIDMRWTCAQLHAEA